MDVNEEKNLGVPSGKVTKDNSENADCGHPRIGHNDGDCCAVCDVGGELDAALELLQAAVVWSPHVGRCMYPKLDCECWLNPAKAFLEAREQPSSSKVASPPTLNVERSLAPETETSESSEPSSLPAAELPEKLRYGSCSRHGFVELSHRCAVYDGEISVKYARVHHHGDRGEGEANERTLRILNEEMRASAERECELLRTCLRDMMRIYESRIRSDCKPHQLEQQPWRVAEYVVAEEALATTRATEGEKE